MDRVKWPLPTLWNAGSCSTAGTASKKASPGSEKLTWPQNAGKPDADHSHLLTLNSYLYPWKGEYQLFGVVKNTGLTCLAWDSQTIMEEQRLCIAGWSKALLIYVYNSTGWHRCLVMSTPVCMTQSSSAAISMLNMSTNWRGAEKGRGKTNLSQAVTCTGERAKDITKTVSILTSQQEWLSAKFI